MPRTVTPTEAAAGDTPPTLSVSQLTTQIKGAMEQAFPDVWVAGEVSNFSRPASGHCYFTLKDDSSQIRAVIWRGSAGRMKFDFTDGLEIVCHGRIDVYGPRGTYQLVIDQAHPQGVGALELALRQLRERLGAEGLFDADRKQPLPALARRIGFVTSPTGAAIRDFLEVARRRWSGANVLVIPTRVQGDGAAKEIAEGIRLANRIKPALDVLVVGRGGGSVEDLWAFNEEPVVRAIAASRIPTVSAVGHEIDVSLSDLAADVRALTPSEAAERVVPAADESMARVAALGERLHGAVRQRVQRRRDQLDALAARRPIARPFDAVHDAARRVDDLQDSLSRAATRITSAGRAILERLAGKLESLSPLAVLSRGYSLTLDNDGRIVRDAAELKVGQTLDLQFDRGRAEATVGTIHPAGD